MYKERLYLIALDTFVYLEYIYSYALYWDRIEHDTGAVTGKCFIPSDRASDLECAAAIKNISPKNK